MTIDFVKKEYTPRTALVPSLKFEEEGGYKDCTVYLDHVAVAFFNSETGGLTLLALETGSGFTGGGEVEDLKYLQDRGVVFDSVPHHWGKEGYEEHYIQITKG